MHHWLVTQHGLRAHGTRKASATLTRMGMAFCENTGAAVNMASVRRNGQMMGESHAISCSSEKPITVYTLP